MNKYKILTLLFLLVSIGVESKADTRSGDQLFWLTPEGQTLYNAELIEAAKKGDIQKVKEFVKRFNINTRDNKDRSPLYWAIKNKHYEVVDVLLENGATVYYVTDNQGWQELMQVANQEIREKLLKKREQDKFIEAAKKGDIERLQYFIDKGVDINVINRYGMTALYEAIHYDRLEAVDVLLKNGAEISTFDSITLSDEMARKLIKEAQNRSDVKSEKSLRKKVLCRGGFKEVNN